MALWARLLNVFAVPGEVFEDVKASPNRAGSWLVPILIASVVGVVATMILLSQPAILQEIRQQQAQALEEKVEQGKLTERQADQALQAIEKFTSPTIMTIFGSSGAVLAAFVSVFWWALILWLIGLLLLRVRFPYLKALEVVGLASMIQVLGAIATVLLQVNLGRTTATPSLGLAVSEFDPTNKLHLVMGAVNLVQIWVIIVLAIGLARLTRVPFSRAAMFVFGFWLLQTAALILIGMGFATL